MGPTPSQLDLSDQFNPAPLLDAGLDEAGRGALAGPVVAAAVILPARFDLPSLGDSKKLSPDLRNRLSPRIKEQALAWSLGCVWPSRIDRINILAATLEAMSMAVAHLKIAPGHLLVDGNQKIPAKVLTSHWRKFQSGPVPTQGTIVGGDAKIPAISAASIIAKTFRDRIMTIFARQFPQYGFERHKGYATREHLRILAICGPSRLHRMSFRGVLPEVTGQAGSLC